MSNSSTGSSFGRFLNLPISSSFTTAPGLEEWPAISAGGSDDGGGGGGGGGCISRVESWLGSATVGSTFCTIFVF